MNFDIAVIGAGAAGLTAGIYGVRGGYKVGVFEALVAGGQIINSTRIDNYPAAPHISGPEFSKNLENQATELGVEIVFDEVSKIIPKDDSFMISTEETTYSAKTVILAVGTKPRKLELSNENDFIGRGLSYCATCDGSFYTSKNVAIVGGGNSALHEALYLSSLAKNVYLIHRKSEFRAEKKLIDSISECKNIKVILNAKVDSLSGDKKLESITLSNGTKVDVDGLFVSIGRVSNAVNLVDGLNLDSDNYIPTSDNCETNIPGLYAAGDVRSKNVRQLVTATGDGAVAAESAIHFLKR